MPSPGSQKVGHLARRGNVGTGRVAVLGRGPRYGTSRAHGSRQLAGVGWGEEGLERSLGPVAHGTRPAFPSGKFEQKRDRQGRMGAGRAGGRWPQGWRLVDGLRGAKGCWALVPWGGGGWSSWELGGWHSGEGWRDRWMVREELGLA